MHMTTRKKKMKTGHQKTSKVGGKESGGENVRRVLHSLLNLRLFASTDIIEKMEEVEVGPEGRNRRKQIVVDTWWLLF